MFIWFIAVITLLAKAEGACESSLIISNLIAKGENGKLENLTYSMKQLSATQYSFSFDGILKTDRPNSDKVSARLVMKPNWGLPMQFDVKMDQMVKDNKVIMDPLVKCSNITRDVPVRAGRYSGTNCLVDLSALKPIISKSAKATIKVANQKNVWLDFSCELTKGCWNS